MLNPRWRRVLFSFYCGMLINSDGYIAQNKQTMPKRRRWLECINSTEYIPVMKCDLISQMTVISFSLKLYPSRIHSGVCDDSG